MKNKRIFVVSDLHGIREPYDSIINELEDLASKSNEEIVLYINGDVIDRGPDSMYILRDVMKRSKGQKGNITVKMLAGNHELNMLEALVDKKGNEWPKKCTWFYGENGGQVTAKQFDALSKKEQEKIVDFICNLPLYETIEGEIFDDKGVILTHARPPRDIKTTDIKVLKDALKSNHNYNEVFKMLWTRDENLKSDERIGIKDYFTIIGHTPITYNGLGFEYSSYDKALNIDGGCAYYAQVDSFDLRVPLVELNFKDKNILINTYDKNGKKRDKYFMEDYYIFRLNDNQINDEATSDKIDDITLSIKEGTVHIKDKMINGAKYVLNNRDAVLGIMAIIVTIELFNIGRTIYNEHKSQEAESEEETNELVLTIDDNDSKTDETTIELTYNVQENDNLTFIADKFNVNIEDIAEYNNIKNINLIYKNQKLLIPYKIKNDELIRFVKFLPGEEKTKSLVKEYHTTKKTIDSLNKIIDSNKDGVVVPDIQAVIEMHDTETVINTSSNIRVLTKKGYI